MRVKFAFKLPDGKAISCEVEKETFTIGRSSKADVVVPFEGLSREHCQVSVAGGNVVLTDLGSPNGVHVNDERIPLRGSVSFNPILDVLNLGGVDVTEFRVVLEEDHFLSDLESSGPSAPSTQAPRKTERTGAARKRITTDDLVKPKSKLHPGLRAMLVLLALSGVAVVGHFLTSDEEDDLYRMQFENNMNNKKSDGSIKTTNF